MADIQGLLQARLSAFDPELDVSAGSLVDTVVIQPIVKALGVDPMLTDSKEFLLQKFYEGFPDYPAVDGDAITDILINASSLFFEAYRLELNRLKKAQSIVNYDQMSNSEMDALAANWLVYRKQGALAAGTIRVVVNRLASISINRNIVFTAKNGKTFTPSLSYIIGISELGINALGNSQYYFDVDVIATSTGITGNIAQFEISTASGIPSLVSVYNESAFVGGADADTNEQLSTTRLLRSVTERSLVTARGINARLDSLTSAIKSSQVIGFGDPEMSRDSVILNGNGELLGMGVAYFEDNLCIINAINGAVTLSIGDYILDQANGIKYSVSSTIGKSDSACFLNSGKTVIVQVDTAAVVGYCAHVCIFSKPRLSLGNETYDNRAHIGGKTDVYLSVQDEVISTTEVDVDNLNNNVSGIGATISGYSAQLTGTTTLTDLQLIDMFVIISGATSFVAQIFYAEKQDNAIKVYFNFDSSLTADLPGARWEIVDTLELDVNNAFTTIYPSNNADILLEVLFNIDDKRVRTNVDLTRTSVRSGDYIHIEGGDFAGDYQISTVQNRTITLSNAATFTSERLNAIIRRSKTALPTPISYIEGVSIGDNALTYAKALGLQLTQVGGSSSVSTGVGFVSGSMHYLIKRSMSEGDQDFKTSLKELSAATIYEISLLEIPHDITLDDGSCILSFYRAAGIKGPKLEADVLLPNDLLVPNTNNIFIALGNITDSDTNKDYPINAIDGDILTIQDGVNKGNYVIQRVYNIRIPLMGGNITRDSNKVATIRTKRSHSLFGNWRLVSIVRIYGEFPVNIYDTFSETFVVPYVKDIVPNANIQYTRRLYDADYMMMLFTDQARLIDPNLVTQRIKASLAALQRVSGIDTVSDTVNDVPLSVIREALDLGARVNYSVGKPAIASGDIILHDDAECVLPAHTYLPYTLNNIALIMSGGSIQKNYTKPVFAADYFGSKFISRCGASRSLIPTTDSKNIETYLPGIGGSAVGTVVPSDAIASRYILGTDDIKLDTVSYTNIDLNPAKGDQLWVLPEIFVANAATPTISRDYVGYVPCICTLEEVPNGYLTRSQINSQLLGNTKKNHAGLTPVQNYAQYADGSSYTYIFKEIDEGLYLNNDYIPIASTVGVQAVNFDAYYYATALTTNTNGLALASATANSNYLYIEKQFDQLDDNIYLDNLAGKHLRILSGVNSGVYNIIDTNPTLRTIYLDRNLQQSTMPVLNRGVCFYRGEDANKLLIIGSPGTTINSEGKAQFVGLDTTFNSGVGFGITSRYATNADIGRYITLYSYVKDDYIMSNSGSFGVIRENLGCFKIDGVNSFTRTSPSMGSAAIAYQELSVAVPTINTLFGMSAEDDKFIDLMFVITDAPPTQVQQFPNSTTSSAALSAFQIYEPIPSKYRVAAVSSNHTTAYLSSYIYAKAPSDINDPLFIKRSTSATNYTFNRNNPIAFVRPGEVKVSALNKLGGLYSGNVELQSLGQDASYNTLNGKVLTTSNERISGYYMTTVDTDTTFSGVENARLRISPVFNNTSVLGQRLSISATISNAVNTAQGLIGTTDERVVCSDTLVKRMLPAFIGADITYISGPTEQDAADHLVRIINNSFSNKPISISTIVRELHKLGATRVVLPMKVYYIVEDLGRVRHYRVIEDLLAVGQDVRIHGSTRIMSKDVAPYGSSRLGATIKLTRSVELSTLGQG